MFHVIAMGAPADGGSAGGLLGAFLPFILILGVMYFLLIRPQMKKQKQHQNMLSELKKGDRVVTSGGMFGTVFGFNDEQNKVILKVSDDVKIEFLKSAISQKVV
jgi:preprotein translocase subunit YajC